MAADGGRIHKQLGVAAHIFLLVLPVGAVLSRVGPQGCPVSALATDLDGGPEIDRTARSWPLITNGGMHAAFSVAFGAGRAVRPARNDDGRRMRQRTVVHESILRIAGARRATAAARRRTTGASSAAARASSVVTLDARRPRSETPRPHHLMAAPSGPRRACGSCARTASRPVGSSELYNGSAAATARRGPATTAGRAAFVQPVAAVVEGFVEVVPAAPRSQNKRPKT